MHAVKTKRRINLSAVVAVILFALLFLAGMISRNAGERHKETPPEQDGPAVETAPLTEEEAEPENRQEEWQLPLRPVDPDKPMVALTFDDGPSGEYSPLILDCLEKNNAVATFFEIGCNVANYPEIDKRAVELGCEIGSHSYYHNVLPGQSQEDIAEDQRLCKEVFENAIGTDPVLIRPPQGSVVKSILNQYDQIFVGWSVDTEDWLYKNVDRTVNNVRQAGNLDGQVILMHSIYQESAQAAEILVPWLIEQGYQLVTVSELFYYHYGITPEKHYYYAYDYFISDGALMLS